MQSRGIGQSKAAWTVTEERTEVMGVAGGGREVVVET